MARAHSSSTAASPLGAGSWALASDRLWKWALRWAVAPANRAVGRVLGQVERLVHHGTVGQHHHRRGHPARQAHELDAAHGRGLGVGADDDGGVVGEAGEEPARLGQHLLDGAVRGREELVHLLGAHGVEVPGRRQVVDEVAVPLSVGMRPAEVCGWVRTPPAPAPPSRCGWSPTRRAPRATGPTWLDPTGCAVSMYSLTTARRMAVFRSSNITPSPFRSALAASGHPNRSVGTRSYRLPTPTR